MNGFSLYLQFFIPVDSDASDEQHQYLLTAASMVGEAVDDLVSSLKRDHSSKFDRRDIFSSCFSMK